MGGVLVASDVTNGPSDPALVAAFEAEQAAAIARIGDTPLSEIPEPGRVASSLPSVRRGPDGLPLGVRGAAAKLSAHPGGGGLDLVGGKGQLRYRPPDEDWHSVLPDRIVQQKATFDPGHNDGVHVWDTSQAQIHEYVESIESAVE